MSDDPDTIFVWVLWHRYGDGSGAHVERAYLDEDRAKEDMELLRAESLAVTSGEWRVDAVKLFGDAPC